jgi:hypothetical protein
MNTHHTPGPWSALEFAGSHPSVGVCVGNSSPADSRSKIKYWIATIPLAKAPGAWTSIQDAGASADEARANARLIASAPEMLAALQAIYAALDQPVQYTGLRTPATTDVLRVDARLAREVALAAIAKATGAPLQPSTFNLQPSPA